MKKIFIGCSSYNSIAEDYFNITKEVALLCIKNNLSLVFGARKEGMMGKLYDAYKENNFLIEGVTTEEYKNDLEKLDCNKKLFDTTLKQIDYFLKCDILLFLPGGIGTLNEIINTITAKRNNETNGKIIIFNYNNYYDNLFELINKFEKEGFSKKEELFKVINTIEELKKELK